ncbi:MAG: hypothetical protein KA444_07390 [Bacteroidia bacterium]|nr:hypothetical protein [Bacteroidia bacterium]
MKYYCIDKPVFVEESVYRRILENVVRKLSKLQNVVAIFQIGGTSSPGISDLDLVVVFKDNTDCNFNLHSELSPEEKYLFIHKLYGCSASFFKQSERFSFFHNFSLKSGLDIHIPVKENSSHPEKIKVQFALEYMLKMYANVMLQKTYGILQVRSLLLHGKALDYDLTFLGITTGELKESVQELLEIRSSWFTEKNNLQNLEDWFEDFCNIYPKELSVILHKHVLYLQGKTPFRIAKNISLDLAASISTHHKGRILPTFPVSFLGKKYFRLQNKFNKFTLNAPFETDNFSPEIRSYFDFVNQHRNYNRQHLPNFYPLTSSLLS